MGVRSRFSLATFGLGADVGESPSADEARAALGGRLSTEPGAGVLVVVSMRRGADATGVVVCVSGTSRDVWLGEGRFVRTTAERVRLLASEEPDLLAVAADAKRFASLREGERVQAIDRSGNAHEGMLSEKCRYGALVVRGETVIAVSFRRVARVAD